MSEGHVKLVGAAEAVAEVLLTAPEAVHCGGAQRHKKQPRDGRGGGGGRTRLREGVESASHQYGAAAALLLLEGLGGLHATNKTSLWNRKKQVLIFFVPCTITNSPVFPKDHI